MMKPNWIGCWLVVMTVLGPAMLLIQGSGGGVAWRFTPLPPADTQSQKFFEIGMLSDGNFGPAASAFSGPSDWLSSFRAGLRDGGYTEGKNVHLEFRNAGGNLEKLATFANELAAMQMDVIVASSTTAAKAAKAATHSIPIVFWGAEPISSGLAESLDHPGENLTGTTANEEQQAEFLAQLREVVPGLQRVAILFNRSYAPVAGLLKYAEEGARALGLSPRLVEVAAADRLPEAFATMKRENCQAVLVLNHGLFFRERAKLAALAIENRIALSTPYLPNAEAGALIAHEADFDAVWRMNAAYVDKILKGAKAGDLPMRKVSFRYAINLKTANALGLTIPQSVVDRAAFVISESGSLRQVKTPQGSGQPITALKAESARDKAKPPTKEEARQVHAGAQAGRRALAHHAVSRGHSAIRRARTLSYSVHNGSAATARGD